MEYLKYLKDSNWIPHPAGIPGVEMNILRSKKDAPCHQSIACVRIAAGASVPPHVHENEDDNLFILEGRAMMRVRDERFEVKPGAQITVPAGVEHEIYEVTGGLMIYDVFAPPAF